MEYPELTSSSGACRSALGLVVAISLFVNSYSHVFNRNLLNSHYLPALPLGACSGSDPLEVLRNEMDLNSIPGNFQGFFFKELKIRL